MVPMIAEMIGVYMIVNLTCIAARSGEGAVPILARIMAFCAVILIVYDLFHMGDQLNTLLSPGSYGAGLLP